MTFLEAALEILKREGRPLHFKELTDRAMTKKLLTFVGRTPELTMQTRLTAAVKKAPGNPFVRVKPGVFGLLRYPEMPPEERQEARAGDGKEPKRGRTERRGGPAEAGESEGRGRRRRRRGGRGRGRGEGARPEVEGGQPTGVDAAARDQSVAERDVADGDEELSVGGLSAEARAAALAETGVLEGDDDMVATDEDADEDAAEAEPIGRDDGEGGDGEDDDGGDEEGEDDETEADAGGAFGAEGRAATGGALDREDEVETQGGDDSDEAEAAEVEEGQGRRRRRRRRRRRGGEGAPAGLEGSSELQTGDNGSLSGETGVAAEGGAGSTAGGAEPEVAAGEIAPGEPSAEAPQSVRRITAPVDAAIEILRGQPPGRGMHVRQIADTAVRRRLVHGEPNEAWRVIRTALAAEAKDRLRNGLRPRVRAAGSGLFALARRPPDGELDRAEQVFGEARRALRERTMAALERRIAELPPGAFEALARVLLQREGFGPTTFIKRVEGTIYVEALRGRGSRPSKCLIALRPGASSAGRRSIGELKAGIRARNQDEGLLMLAGRVAEDAIAEWKQAGPPLEIADGAALAETALRHGVGVLTASVNVDFVDADFFSELAEG